MTENGSSEALKYGCGEERNAAQTLHFQPASLGQLNPQHCPYPEAAISGSSSNSNPLGEPLAIEEVARLLGCSAWTVRQRYVRQGLPYLQARPRGKLVFFRAQVVAWIEKRQRHMKGGFLR